MSKALYLAASYALYKVELLDQWEAYRRLEYGVIGVGTFGEVREKFEISTVPDF